MGTAEKAWRGHAERNAGVDAERNAEKANRPVLRKHVGKKSDSPKKVS